MPKPPYSIQHPVFEYLHNQRRRSFSEQGKAFLILIFVGLLSNFSLTLPPSHAADPPASPSTETSLTLSLNEAVALFLKQNFDLLITKYGIDHAKGAQITARLFPNPVFTIVGGAAFVQNQRFEETQFILPQLTQTFIIAGKRGYRMESTEYGTRTAEANFEDAIRQLALTVKDTYFRVKFAERRLELALENQARFARIQEINTLRLRKGDIAEVDLIRIRLQKMEFDTQVFQVTQEANAVMAELRQILGISPIIEVTLTTDLAYARIELDIGNLRQVALENRPDIRGRQATLSQRKAEFQLAKALRFPDPQLGYAFNIQAAGGNSNNQLHSFIFSVPLPVFDRNQGGIAQAEVALQVAQTEIQKTKNQIQNEVDVGYRNLLESRSLAEAFQKGVLQDSQATIDIIQQAYRRGGATILELLDAFRTFNIIQQNYLEALFNNLRNQFLLENALGQGTL